MKKTNILLLVLWIISNLAYAESKIDVEFSPNGQSADLVLKVINSAQSSICMATYNFTLPSIAKALVAAKKRGVDVKVISDYKANSKKYTVTRFLASQGVNIRLNDNYAIMHNKFIVIDNKTLETGSLNYSQAAVKMNAENVLVIWDNPQLANKYTVECNRLFNEGTTLKASY
jgi:phosphatidylserine/phosphatidylglycerophosphate/cardiolipin synthase-like enzyme